MGPDPSNRRTAPRALGPILARLTAALASAMFTALVPVGAAAATFGFYAPWDPRSAGALAQAAGAMDWFAPAWITVTGPSDRIGVNADAAARAILAARTVRPRLMPLVQNITGGVWDGPDAAALLASPARRAALLDRLEPILAGMGADGVMFDFENLPPAAQSGYQALLAEARARFAARHWPIAVAAPADDDSWSLPAYAGLADYVVLMAYDEHWITGAPGPIASRGWFAAAVREAAAAVPPAKLVVGLAAYAYDWPAGASAQPIAVLDAEALGARPGARIRRDPASGELTVRYVEAGRPHVVWIADAQSNRAEIAAARRLGARNFAVWRLGSEDPTVWSLLR